MWSWIKRHGRVYEISVPIFCRSAVVSDPALVRSVLTATAEKLADVEPNLGTLVWAKCGCAGVRKATSRTGVGLVAARSRSAVSCLPDG